MGDTVQVCEGRRTEDDQRIDGVVIGLLVGCDESGVPLVAFPGNPAAVAAPARSTVQLSGDDVGREVALMFENGDPERPLVIGRVHRPDEMSFSQNTRPHAADVDGRRIEFTAKDEIVLRCGEASITLTKAGKILLRGTYLLSRSSGVNRIKGGSVQLN